MTSSDTQQLNATSQDSFRVGGEMITVQSVQSVRNFGWLPLLVILATGLFYLMTIRSGHEWGDDFSLYLIHAKNIASGAEYRQSGYLHYPSYLGPDAYPPIFPLLLAPVYWFLGLNLTAMKVVVILSFLAALFAFTLVTKNEMSTGWQVALLVAIGFNPYIWDQKDRLTSDLTFLFFAYFGIALVNKAYHAGSTGAKKWLFIFAIGTVFYLAYGTRSLGVLLIPSLLLYDVLRNRRLVPSGFAINIAILTGCLIILQAWLLHSERGYYEQFATSFQYSPGAWLKYIFGNVVSYVRSLTDVWDNGFSRPLRLTLTILVTVLASVGYFVKVRKEVSYADLFVVIYVFVVCIVPMDGGGRYLLPVIPFYMFYAEQGIRTFLIPKKAKSIGVALLATAILISYVAQYRRQNLKQFDEGISKPESVEFFNYVVECTQPTDVFIFTKPRALALFTGHKASFYPKSLSDKGLWNYFQSIHATNIVVGPKGISPTEQEFLIAFVHKYLSSLREEFVNEDFTSYRIVGIPNANGRTGYGAVRLTDPLPQNEP